jgi:hypothetical protein
MPAVITDSLPEKTGTNPEFYFLLHPESLNSMENICVLPEIVSNNGMKYSGWRDP